LTCKKISVNPGGEFRICGGITDIRSAGDASVPWYGQIEVQAQVTDAVISGLVSLLHGWAEANVNRLTDHKNGDPVLATTPSRSGACRL
jgi:hypothetical protein